MDLWHPSPTHEIRENNVIQIYILEKNEIGRADIVKTDMLVGERVHVLYYVVGKHNGLLLVLLVWAYLQPQRCLCMSN